MRTHHPDLVLHHARTVKRAEEAKLLRCAPALRVTRLARGGTPEASGRGTSIEIRRPAARRTGYGWRSDGTLEWRVAVSPLFFILCFAAVVRWLGAGSRPGGGMGLPPSTAFVSRS